MLGHNQGSESSPFQPLPPAYTYLCSLVPWPFLPIGPDSAAVVVLCQERNILLETQTAVHQQRFHFKPSHRLRTFPGPKIHHEQPRMEQCCALN